MLQKKFDQTIDFDLMINFDLIAWDYSWHEREIQCVDIS